MAERWVKWLGNGRREVWDYVWPRHGAILPVEAVQAELLMQRCRGQFDYDDPPELLQVKGIGPETAVELMTAGIRTLGDLAMADSGPVDERLARWAREARKLLAGQAKAGPGQEQEE